MTLKVKFLQKKIEKLQEEIARLKRGEFTPEEFQNICHNLPETCSKEDFEKGCKEYQEKLFGDSIRNE